ncbi:MAG: hypothetical protein CMM52_10890 [Rhodospirillaceae bacterium]|nr:hypothetical protein [Rhodospirillaceae bacterium]
MDSAKNNKEYSIAVQPRRFIEEISIPFLPGLKLHDPSRKPRGMEALKKKLGKAGDEIFHGWLNVPARGIFTIRMSDGTYRKFEFDAHQSAYMALISREKFGGYEPIETMFLESMLPKAQSFYDVGANCGYFTLLAVTHPDFNGKIHAFELTNVMNTALKNMVKALDLKSVEIADCGLSDHTGSVFMTASEATHLTKVVAEDETAKQEIVEGEAKKLDDVLFAPPDLLKVDVEDHECAVFRRGEQILKQHQPLIIFESRGSNSGGAGELLKTYGYDLYSLHQGSGAENTIDLKPADTTEDIAGQENLVAVPAGQEPRWFTG